MASAYFPILLTIFFALFIIVVMVVLAEVFGPQRKTKVKQEVFECGNPPTDSARKRLSIQFFLIAMLFILFDIEMVYLFPWAVLFRSLGLFGLLEMGMFLGILILGLVYCWRKGGLDWA